MCRLIGCLRCGDLIRVRGKIVVCRGRAVRVITSSQFTGLDDLLFCIGIRAKRLRLARELEVMGHSRFYFGNVVERNGIAHLDPVLGPVALHVASVKIRAFLYPVLRLVAFAAEVAQVDVVAARQIGREARLDVAGRWTIIAACGEQCRKRSRERETCILHRSCFHGWVVLG
ncbi:hypothetical protein Y600_6155 [Burkholderia pseudomallei MSHR3709]|nr:hypothetical protein Y600_6155 [Burkholderia pseudomallei MSHR3709]